MEFTFGKLSEIILNKGLLMEYKLYSKLKENIGEASKYCVVDREGNAYLGDTMRDIIPQICDWDLVGEHRDLVFQFKGFKKTKTMSYGKLDPSDSNVFGEEEAYKHAVGHLTNTMSDYGFTLYQKK